MPSGRLRKTRIETSTVVPAAAKTLAKMPRRQTFPGRDEGVCGKARSVSSLQLTTFATVLSTNAEAYVRCMHAAAHCDDAPPPRRGDGTRALTYLPLKHAFCARYFFLCCVSV